MTCQHNINFEQQAWFESWESTLEEASTQQTERSPERDKGVRSLYHKLAMRFHPDRAEDDAQRAEHEDVMRVVNDAYHGGDTERLLELSRELGMDVEGLNKASDGLLSELVRQYEEIKQEVWAIRHSFSGAMVVDTRRAKRQGTPTPLEAMRAEGETIVSQLTDVRDFVSDFAAGKITFEEFMVGPMVDDEEFADEEDLLLMFMDMLEDLEQSFNAAQRQRGRTKKTKKRVKKRTRKNDRRRRASRR